MNNEWSYVSGPFGGGCCRKFVILLPEFSGPIRGGSPGVPSAAVSADISKVLPPRLSQEPLSDVAATDPFN